MLHRLLDPLPIFPARFRSRRHRSGLRVAGHSFELRARFASLPDPAAVRRALHVTRHICHQFLIVFEVDVLILPCPIQERADDKRKITATGGIDGAVFAYCCAGLDADEGGSEFLAVEEEQRAAPDVCAEEGAGARGEEGTPVAVGGGVPHTAREDVGGIESCGDAVCHGCRADRSLAVRRDVMAVEEEAGVLEVDDWSQGPGIEVLVGFRVEMRREGCEACVEVLFEGLEGCGADGDRS